MAPSSSSDPRATPHEPADPRALTGQWVAALTASTPMNSVEIEEILTGLANTILAGAQRADPSVGYVVGAALPKAQISSDEALETTVTLLAAHLSGHASPTVVTEMISEVTRGFIDGMQDHIRNEQETLSHAVHTALRQSEKEWRASEAKFRAVVETAAVGVGLADIHGKIIDINPALAHMLGRDRDQVKSMSVHEFAYPDDPSHIEWFYQQMIAGEIDHYQLQKRYIRPDGTDVWAHLSVSLIRGEDGEPCYTMAIIDDISERVRMQTRLEHLATHDPLTQLPNRALFLERLERACAVYSVREQLALFYLDLDNFRAINDRFGHETGDRLLALVGERLAHQLGDQALIARLGGDEFVLLTGEHHNTRCEDTSLMAQRILETLAEPFTVDGRELDVTASVGIVEHVPPGADAHQLLRDADLTLYWAKADGKTRYAVFDERRSTMEITGYTLSHAMPAAFERNEFFIEYQPIMALANGQLVGVEALLRWRHPRYGVVVPQQFIRLAEKTGFIDRLGSWVLDHSCAQLARWRDGGLWNDDCVISINVAPSQVHQPTFADEVLQIVKRNNVDPSLLQLEVTEDTFVRTHGRPVISLQRLYDAGVHISIDDFGTGYSNLAYLRELPVHNLKIAGTFVDGLAIPQPNRLDAQLASSLIQLAHVLGLTVTAERVEVAAQVQRLRVLGCENGQGWYFGTPVSATDMGELLKN